MALELTQPAAPATARAWRDKQAIDRAEWFEEHGDAVARMRGSMIQALDAYAALIAKTGAHENPGFRSTTFVNDVLDLADATLAEEVRTWLGA